MTRFDVYATIKDVEEKILDSYPAKDEADAKAAGRRWLRMSGRTPARSQLTKTDQTRAPIRAEEVTST